MRFKAHPLYIIRNIGFWSLIATITFLKEKKIVLFFAILIFLILSICRYRHFEIKTNGVAIVLKTGFLRVRRAVIPIKSISSVEILQYPADKLFSAVSVRLNTEAAGVGEDCRFVLWANQKEEFLSSLNIKELKNAGRFSFGQILLLSAVASSAINGVILVLPILNRFGNLLGVHLPQLFFEQIDNISRSLPYFDRIKNGLTIAFAVFYVCALIFYLAVYANFKVCSNRTHICVRYGILTKRSVFINKALVGSYVSARTPIMLLFKRKFIKADIAHSNRRGERSVLLAPAIKSNQNPFTEKERLTKERFINASCASRYRFYKFPFYLFSVFTLLFCVLTHLIKDFWQLVLFFYLLSLGCVLLMVAYAVFSQKRQKISFGKTVLAAFVKGYEWQETQFSAKNIGIIKIIRFPLDLKEHTCNIKITLRTKNAFSTRVKYISYDDFCEQMRNFDINE